MKEDKIVYAYNWRELVMVTRDASGNWQTSWDWYKVIRRYNNKDNGEKLRFGFNEDFIHLVEQFAIIRHHIVQRCKRSYGDEVDEINLNKNRIYISK